VTPDPSMSYSDYLALDQLLSAQHPRSAPEHHDELLFIIQHQTTELWLKLLLHELTAVRAHLAADDLARSQKTLARAKQILRTMTEQWSVLASMTPSEYVGFRGSLGSSSGFQSYQYRSVEFVLGNKRAGMLRAFEGDPAAHALLTGLLESPSLYDEFLRMLARHGIAVPADVLERDVTQAWVEVPSLVEPLTSVYADTVTHWHLYAVCEDLVDFEDAFQVWRFRHMRTVQRIIGAKSGTGGSSGVDFLKRALDINFFPELIAVRTRLDG
jgi:tryptophan 2,3-dioxygenase